MISSKTAQPKALEDVEPGCEVRAALAERRALQHHRRHARVGADHRRHAEHRVPDQAAEDGREHRVAQREVEVARRDEHEERDAEVDPEQDRVEQAEHPKPLGNGLDAPARRVVHGVSDSLRR